MLQDYRTFNFRNFRNFVRVKDGNVDINWWQRYIADFTSAIIIWSITYGPSYGP